MRPVMVHIDASNNFPFPSLPTLEAAPCGASFNSPTVFTLRHFIHASGSFELHCFPASELAAASASAT